MAILRLRAKSGGLRANRRGLARPRVRLRDHWRRRSLELARCTAFCVDQSDLVVHVFCIYMQ